MKTLRSIVLVTMIAANNTGSHDTVRLSNKVYSLLIPVRFGDFGFAQVADLDVYDDLTIEGPTGGSAKANIDANGATMGDRAFDLHGADTDVTMRRLIITEGRAALQVTTTTAMEGRTSPTEAPSGSKRAPHSPATR